jgi:ABC-type branched-subunit amino acid transport system ATPase component
LTSSIGLLILVMYFPGGFMQLGYQLRDAIVGWAARRYPAPERERVSAAARSLPHREAIDIAVGTPLLVASDVRVTFGGVNAVGGVSVTVGQNEIVGLIGANGAGKSTFMNAVSGLVKTSGGSIEAFGAEIAHLPTHKRHGRTLGRGYQAARLYPDLTVRETILVALEAQERTPYFPALLNIPPYRGIERKHNVEAAEIIDFLGLGRYADQHASNLSTGTRRIVEFGCLLAMSPKLILLDEPTGGVAQKETEAFGPLIRRISKELGASVMIIEHDMPLVMSVSDRMYCLETGLVIAEGTPAEVRNNPRVIASYLGTDERAIQRSGSGQ